MMILLYHNTRCKISREALKILQDNAQDYKVIEYMKTPLSMEDIKDLLIRLNLSPQQLLRKNERLFRQNYKGLEFNDEEWIKVMSENPVLIERPIAVKGSKAIIARPSQRILYLIK